MKTKYIFIHCEREFSAQTAIYTVYIGNSARDQKQLDFVRKFAVSSQSFFARYSHEVAEFLLRLHDSVSSLSWLLHDVPARRHVTLSALVSMCRQRSFAPAPLSSGYCSFNSQLTHTPRRTAL